MLGAKGLVFFAAIELAFLATAYSNLFFLLLAFLGATALLGTTGAIRNLRGATVTPLHAAPAPAGSAHELRLRIDAGRSVRFQVEVRVDAGTGWCDAARLPLAAGSTTIAATVGPLPRGVHRLRAIELASRHPFGLVRASRRLNFAARRPDDAVDIEFVAFPPPATLPAGDLRTSIAELTGDRLLPRGRDQLSGLRPFRTGDAVRDVHWRATARLRAPVVAERDEQADDDLEVCFDRRAAAERFDDALGVLTALVLATRDRKQTIRIHSQDHDAVYGEGQQPFAAALRWLAAVQPLPADAAAPRGARRGAVLLPLRPRAGDAIDA